MLNKNSLSIEFKNAPTLYKIFSQFYKDRFDTDYKNHTFIGRETKALKEAIQTFGFYPLVGAFYGGVKQGRKDVHIMYILGGINAYLPACRRPDLYASVLLYGDADIRHIWRIVINLETKWFPTASDKQRLAKAIETLEKWNDTN